MYLGRDLVELYLITSGFVYLKIYPYYYRAESTGRWVNLFKNGFVYKTLWNIYLLWVLYYLSHWSIVFDMEWIYKLIL